MTPQQHDISIIERIVEYCDEINKTTAHFGASLATLKANSIYKNALAMCILQIGELTTHLTNEFKITHPMVPWNEIKKMRNIAAHHYGSFSVEFLWDTVMDDIAPLRENCRACIAELEMPSAVESDT